MKHTQTEETLGSHDPFEHWIADARDALDQGSDQSAREMAAGALRVRETLRGRRRRVNISSLLYAALAVATIAAVWSLPWHGVGPGLMTGLGLTTLMAAWAVRREGLRGQVFARASMWALFGTYVINSVVVGMNNQPPNGMGLLGVVCGALVVWLGVAWRQDAHTAHDPEFQPTAFRTILLLSLMMAVGDALVLGNAAMLGVVDVAETIRGRFHEDSYTYYWSHRLSGSETLAGKVVDMLTLNFSSDLHHHLSGGPADVTARGGWGDLPRTSVGRYHSKNLVIHNLLPGAILPALGCGVMLLCARGLLRLKSWALFGTVAMNWVVMGACLGEYIDAGYGALLLTFTSVIQLFLPVPILAAMVRGRVIERPRLARVLGQLGTAMVVVLCGWMLIDALW